MRRSRSLIDGQLTAVERETLIDLDRLAKRFEEQARQLYYAIEFCKRNNTLEGLSEMVAFSFNSQQFTPQYGGGGQQLPAGPNGENVKYKVMIVDHQQMDTKDNFGNVKGGYIALELASIEGPTQGKRQIDRLNLLNSNPKVVEIANSQLSAYCHVLGKFQFNDFAELQNVPFMVEIGLQTDKNGTVSPQGYTEVKKLFDINGNEPGKAGAGPQANQQQNQQPNIPQNPAGGVQPQGNGWGGAPNGGGNPPQNNNGGYPVDSNVPMNGGGNPNPQNNGQPNGGQWGGPQGGNPNPPQNDPNAQGGGWGQPNQGQPQQNQQQPNPNQGQPQNNGGNGWGGPQGQPNGGNAGWGAR